MEANKLNEIDEIHLFSTDKPIEKIEYKIDPKIKEQEIKEKKEEREDFEKKRNEALKQRWEKHLHRKILTIEEYNKLKNASSILTYVKYIFLAIVLIAFLIFLFNFNNSFKNKDFTKETNIELNNSVNPVNNIQTFVNSTNLGPNIYLNISVNIDKIILNNSNGTN